MGGELPAGIGLFFPVTIVGKPPENSRIVQEEPFGPIFPLLKTKDVEEVFKRASAMEYGQAGSVWCRNEESALSIARRLPTDTVRIIEIQTPSPHKLMAGQKQSGFGVEKGLEGLAEHTLPQTISVRRAAAG